MKPLRLYLDTSIINFLFADDAPEKREATGKFLAQVAQGARLANIHRERRISVVNRSLGYVYPMRIASPPEVMNYG